MDAKQPTILTNLQRGNVKRENPIYSHQRTLHELAAQGELYNVEPFSVDEPDSNHMTPLHWAAGYGQNSTVEILLGFGANPNYKSNCGQTALMFAASRGFFHVVKTLIRAGANVNEVDENCNSALIYAVHQDQALVVQELLRNDANLGIANSFGQTAYSLAMIKRNKSSQAAIEAYLIALCK